MLLTGHAVGELAKERGRWFLDVNLILRDDLRHRVGRLPARDHNLSLPSSTHPTHRHRVTVTMHYHYRTNLR